MKRNMLTSDERSKILNLRKKGHSLNGISRELQRSVDTVRKFVRDPEGYTKIAKNYSFKELKAITPKKVNKGNNVKTTKNNTLKDVILEHRAVIKFLTKQGQTVTQIFSNLKKVYDRAVPDYDSVKFWCWEYKNGRETLLNEASAKKNHKVSIKKSVKRLKPATLKKSKPTPKKLKLGTTLKKTPKKSATQIKVVKSSAKKPGIIKKKVAPVKKTIAKAAIQPKKEIEKVNQSPVAAIEQKLKTIPIKKNLFQIKLLPISKKIIS